MESRERDEFIRRVRLAGNPVAHPESVVVLGDVRFTVLTARLLRLEWSPTGEFTDFATFAFPSRSEGQLAPFTVREDGERLSIETEALTLTYRLNSGPFAAANLSIALRVGDAIQTWRPGQQDSGNLGGTRRTLDLTGGEVPLEPGLVSRDGWAVYDDSRGVVLRPDDGWVSERPPQSLQDWYFFGYGHAYADALAEYTRFGGATPLIPRYVLGIWWSRFWPYSATDFEALVTEFAEHRVPLDVLVVDMDWHLPGHWTGYTWNAELFPDPEAFLAAMHARGLRVTLNLHPADGVKSHEYAYEAMASALGMASPDGATIPFRITDRRFAEQYFALLHHPLERQGVDFWWLDWQQGESTDIEGLDPLLWLNHLHFADAGRSGQRPLLFSRWGGLGNHRYPIGFSGDTFAGWATLAAQPRFTATAANVGFGWWSHDIGGHFGSVGSELLTRWIQFAALSPCLRLHAVKHPLAERRPWAFPPTALDAMRKAFGLRYELVPYLYTMSRHAHERGVALCRPMYYAYPEHEAAYLADGQYQLGDDLLAAPVTEPADPDTGLAAKDVWIPPGTWYRFDTGEAFVGPRWVRIACDLATIPLFARSGAIIPLAQPALHLSDLPADRLDIRVFPGGNGAFRLYEDDGVSDAYLRGDYEWTPLTLASVGAARCVLRIGAVEGACSALPPDCAYHVTFMDADRPAGVSDDTGAALPWSYDSATRRVDVALPARPKDEPRSLAVEWTAGADAGLEAHAGPRSAGMPPFMHVIPSTATDEARHHLARVILVPPYGPDERAGACSAEVTWRDTNYSGVAEVREVVGDFTADTLLTAPFELASPTDSHHWEVEARFLVGDKRVTETYSGPYTSPPIQRWSLRYTGEEAWRVVEADMARRLTVTEPLEVQLDTTQGVETEVRADIELAEATAVWCDAWTNGDMALAIDGQAPNSSEPLLTVAGLALPWPAARYGPVTLPAGRHTITARLSAPAESPWVFGVVLVDEHGAPLTRIAYATDESGEP